MAAREQEELGLEVRSPAVGPRAKEAWHLAKGKRLKMAFVVALADQGRLPNPARSEGFWSGLMAWYTFIFVFVFVFLL